jgi:hypothetical protein
MVSYRTLSKLASARNRAEQAGLSDIAERIELLRKELRGFHELPSELRVSKICWAKGKVEETKKAMEQELEQPYKEEVRRERQAGHAIIATITKIFLCAGALFSAIPAFINHPNDRFLTGTGFVLGTIVMAGIIDHAIGPKNARDAADTISYMLDEIKASLSMHRKEA